MKSMTKIQNIEQTFIKEIENMYPCFIAVIKYGYEFGCVYIKSRVR